MTPPDAPRRLGRGLEALIGSVAPPAASSPTDARRGQSGDGIERILIAHIRANPFQPRKEFAPSELDDLTASLRTTGLLQPITVRPAPAPATGYEVVAGERRLRAATQLGWTDIPAIVRAIDDRTALTIALVENLQRTDLNPMEEAEGYARLAKDFNLTQHQIADAVGKHRSTVANSLRLLHLPPPIRKLLRTGELTLGHARALLALPTEREIMAAARRIIGQNLTVRDTERLARNTKATVKGQDGRSSAKRSLDATVREIEDRLRRHLQTDVRVKLTGRDRGQLSILFYSNDDLERVLELILGAARPSASLSREAL